METRGGRVHHAYGRCAPYIRNSRTIHAVPMHHHPRFCCSLGAAYAQKLAGHDIMALKQFDPDTRYMIVSDVLSHESSMG